tara:strand:+ start:113 stop:337 length:225 start_codon:yes stop_codon:yes gene_type:complete
MLSLVIQQKRPPNTRFHVRYDGQWAAFNTFAEVVDWLHSLELDELEPYVDLTEDSLEDEIVQAYIELTANSRAG